MLLLGIEASEVKPCSVLMAASDLTLLVTNSRYCGIFVHHEPQQDLPLIIS